MIWPQNLRGDFVFQYISAQPLQPKTGYTYLHIDYQKAFNIINHEQLLIKYLHNVKVGEKYVRIIIWYQFACVTLKSNKLKDDFEIKRGVRQVCMISPTLFNLYVESVFLKALQDYYKSK